MLGVVIVVGFGQAFAQTPKDDFGSDELVNVSVSEIRRLDRDQLEAFIEYVATCGSVVDTKEREFACERATGRFEIKGHTAVRTQRLIFALALTDRIVKGRWDRARDEEQERLANDVKRRVDILRRWRSAASDRYAELARGSTRP